jgi:hypothetical protein
MPCYSWGIPAQTCQVGAKLMEVESSVCRSCYALKGFFRRSNVRNAYERRLGRSGDPRWIMAMVKLVYWQTAETGQPYFRWFDSGDLQSVAMFRQIAAVALQTPEIWHWLPTREYRIVREYLRHEHPPENLLIRISAPLVNGPAPRNFGLPTSTVHSADGGSGYICPARTATPPNCGSCRACWDGEVENVSYPLH